MVHLRPPLMSKGQADDFYAYSAIGTGLFWLAGGLATGPVALTLALCGAGAAINHAPKKSNNPNMQWTTPTGPPPFPNDMPPEPRQYVVEREKELEQRFGMNAVYCYRTMIYEGQALGPAFETLWNSLAHLKSQGYWRNGQIQGSDGEGPPGHPDPNDEQPISLTSLKEFFFGRTELYPATEEDMRGLP